MNAELQSEGMYVIGERLEHCTLRGRREAIYWRSVPSMFVKTELCLRGIARG